MTIILDTTTPNFLVDLINKGAELMDSPGPGLAKVKYGSVVYIFNENGTLKYTIEWVLNEDKQVEYYFDGHTKIKTNWNGLMQPDVKVNNIP